VLHGKRNSSYNSVASDAYNLLTSFKDANSYKFSRIEVEKRELSWKAPMNGFVKVNWDAAVDKKKMGIDVINRDSKGKVLATLAEPQDNIIAPDVAEAMAALRAVNFSSPLGFFKIILEGDAL
jgi:hypothetical protein